MFGAVRDRAYSISKCGSQSERSDTYVTRMSMPKRTGSTPSVVTAGSD